jgi:hypothetical protein
MPRISVSCVSETRRSSQLLFHVNYVNQLLDRIIVIKYVDGRFE